MNEICCKCNLPKVNSNQHNGSATFRYICRLCLMRAEDTEPIFIHPGDDTLADKIYTCTGVQVNEHAAVGPTSICMSCKSSIYKFYQFLQLCQRNDKIIQNLLVNHETSKPENQPGNNNLRLIIRTNSASVNPRTIIKRKRINSRRKSTRSNLEQSTSASDISWSDRDDDKEEQADETDDGTPNRHLVYETDTQEEPAKKQKVEISKPKVPSLVISFARLNGGFTRRPSLNGVSGRVSRASTVEPIGKDDLFQCEFCEGSFPYRIQIKQHIDLYHADRKNELSCKFCSKTYFTTDALRSHCAQRHPTAVTIECKLCERYFSSQQALYKHYSSLMHRAACGEAVYPQQRRSSQCYSSSSRRTSFSSDFGSDYAENTNKLSHRSPSSVRILEDDFNPYEDLYFNEVITYKCDYCEARFDDKLSLAKHTEVRPCRVELELLDLDLLLEKMDLDELLMPLNNAPDVTIIEPPIEIVDLT